MTTTHLLQKIALLSLAAMLAWGADAAYGQFNWTNAGEGNWNTDGNWDQGFPPEGSFGDNGSISNGGTAVVNANTAGVNALQVGPGTLRIENGGSLGAQDTVTISPNGNLEVLGGAFTAPQLTAGAVALSGTGSISVSGNALLTGTTRVTGNTAAFNVGGDLTIGGSFVSAITNASAHTAINVVGAANLSGDLTVEFSGVTPSLGNSWPLVSGSTGVAGGFNSITGPALTAGLGYKVNTAGGNVDLEVAGVLALLVNRDTGAARLQNSISNINAELIEIGSASGLLSPATYTGLTGLGYDSSSWLNGSPNGGNPLGIAEARVNPLGSSTFNTSTDLQLGQLVDVSLPAFGESLDIAFSYLEGGSTVPTIGTVVYEGDDLNNLVLYADPETGNAAIKNQSRFDVDLSLYELQSESGALVPAGWDSFAEQNVDGGKWLNGVGATNGLVESHIDAATTLSAGSIFDLGAPFNAAGDEDLSFQFLLDGETDTRSGIVLYQAPTTTTDPADLNSDGFVDGLDLGILLGSFNTATTPSMGELNGTDPVDGLDLGILLGAWNPPPASAVSAVPEPTSIALLVLASVSMLSVQRKRS